MISVMNPYSCCKIQFHFYQVLQYQTRVQNLDAMKSLKQLAIDNVSEIMESFPVAHLENNSLKKLPQKSVEI